MKKVMLLLALALSACAPKAIRVEIPGADKVVSTPFVDERPASEKENAIGSLMITSSTYGTYKKGDALLDPPAPELFRLMAYERLTREAATVPNITLHHMVVYLNMKAELRKGVAGGLVGGAIGGAIVGSIAAANTVNVSQSIVDPQQFDASAKDEFTRSLYTEEENPQHASVFVTYIDATTNGKRLFVKAMAPFRSGAPEAIKGAINYYLDQYIAALPKPAAAAPAVAAPVAAAPVAATTAPITPDAASLCSQTLASRGLTTSCRLEGTAGSSVLVVELPAPQAASNLVRADIQSLIAAQCTAANAGGAIQLLAPATQVKSTMPCATRAWSAWSK